MKKQVKIGLIGGMSWESSAEYYRLLNEEIKSRLGGFHSCHCLLESLDFAEVEKLQHQGDWEILCQLMGQTAQNLERAGAGIILLCTNTMHLCSESVQMGLKVPFLHIAEATGQKIREQGLGKVGLLGTSFTMEKDFYRALIYKKFGIEVLVPDAQDRQVVHQTIYQELVQGKFTSSSRSAFKRIIGDLEKNGAQGIILGCTEIPLLIGSKDVDLPLFDTTRIHVEAALDLVLKDQ